jgi:hypothetical protein
MILTVPDEGCSNLIKYISNKQGQCRSTITQGDKSDTHSLRGDKSDTHSLGSINIKCIVKGNWNCYY